MQCSASGPKHFRSSHSNKRSSDNMLTKIAALLSVVLLCAGETEHQTHEKHAISSQSYHRDDVPLSYKYTAIHPYEKPKHMDQSHQHYQYHTSERPEAVHESPQYQASDPTSLYSKVALKNIQKYIYGHNQGIVPPTSDHLIPAFQGRSLPGSIQHQPTSIQYIPVQNGIHHYDTENSNSSKIKPKQNFNNKVNYLKQYLTGHDDVKTFAFVPAIKGKSLQQHYYTQQHFGVPSSNAYNEGKSKAVKLEANAQKILQEITQKTPLNFGHTYNYVPVAPQPNYDPAILNHNTYKAMFRSNSETTPIQNHKIVVIPMPNTSRFFHL